MKKQHVLYIIAGVITLSACAVQADNPPASNAAAVAADGPTSGQNLSDLQRDLADAEQRVEEAVKGKSRLRDLGVAIATPGVRIGAGGYGGGFRMDLGANNRQNSSVLIIPDKPVDREQLAQMAEDMQVMAMILEETVHPNQPSGPFGYGRGLGISIGTGFFGNAANRSPRALWVQGCGVVFTLEVDFPLVALDESEQTPSDEQSEKTDEIWQRSKNLLKGRSAPGDQQTSESAQYDLVQVQQLQERLTRALRHASNIRHLPDKDRVVVVVRSLIDGQAVSIPGGETDASVAVPTSVMTLQAAIRDIKAFADDRMDTAQFAEKVAVVIY